MKPKIKSPITLYLPMEITLPVLIISIFIFGLWLLTPTCQPFDLQITVIDDTTNQPIIANITITKNNNDNKFDHRGGAVSYAMCKGQTASINITEPGYAQWAVDVRAPENGTTAGLTGTARLKPLTR